MPFRHPRLAASISSSFASRKDHPAHGGLWIAYSLNLRMGNTGIDCKLLKAGIPLRLEGSMFSQNLRCAYCGKPLAFTTYGIEAWRVRNEICLQ